ncbi:hypothetical protein CK203_106261 [Vitis vinifera]|uniref:Integrase catalytic domain-containing protein n=1 Tax=Vitis vinifera TaxID=29760 RepID=A0A438FHF4_VITVI|nr:hypothetical protein CK203_106261 [Vitis vinifera]
MSMSFNTGFPKVQGYWFIIMVVDRFSKYAMFILAQHECLVEEAMILFFRNVAKYFGIPKDIVSDRGSQFICKFLGGVVQDDGNSMQVLHHQSPLDGWATPWPHEQPVSNARCNMWDRYLKMVCKLLAHMGGEVSSCGTTLRHNDTRIVGTWMGCLGQMSHTTTGMSIALAARALMHESSMHR